MRWPVVAAWMTGVNDGTPAAGVPPVVNVSTPAASAPPPAAPDAPSEMAPSLVPDPESPPVVGQSTRFPRLTHLQWRNTLTDLFDLTEEQLQYDLAVDAAAGLYDTNQARTKVGSALRADYERAAEDIALRLTPNLDAVQTLIGPSASMADMPAGLIDSLVKKLYRRPATAADHERLTRIYQTGTTSYTDVDASVGGARLLLAFMLQAPQFLYRVELSSEVDPTTGFIPLSAFELATRLSYLMLNSAPDAELFAAAESGTLATDEGLAEQVQRLAASPKAVRMIDNFYAQGLGSDVWGELNKSDILYPNYTVEVSSHFERSALMFVRDVALTQEGGLREMLLTPMAYVNQALAPWYGLEPASFGAELVRADLNPTERAGLLTQLGFLAYYASTSETDPIHRGNYINQRLLCRAVPAPPTEVPALPEDESGATTMRERVEFHTTACGGGCHALLLNAAGFAFERYGALGEIRELDNGQPVNATATLNIGGGEQTYDGAVEFSNILAEAEEVHDCYTGQWVEYALGRDLQPADEQLVAAVANSSYAERTPILQLVSQIANSLNFKVRAPEALTQENNQ